MGDPGVSVWQVNRGERKFLRLHFIFTLFAHFRFAGGSIREGSRDLRLMSEQRRRKVSKTAFYLLIFPHLRFTGSSIREWSWDLRLFTRTFYLPHLRFSLFAYFSLQVAAFVRDPGVSIWHVNGRERKFRRLHFIFPISGSQAAAFVRDPGISVCSKTAFYPLIFPPSQVHRQAKALRRLSHYLRSHKLRADQHMGFFVPLIYSYILDKRYAKSGKVFNFLIYVDCSVELCSCALIFFLASAMLFIANLCIIWALKASMSAW